MNRGTPRSLHLRLYRKKTKQDKLRIALDKLILIICFVGPVMTIPQVWNIWILKQTAGVSAITWWTYQFTVLVWLVYGYAHKDRAIILSSWLWILVQGMILLGLIIH